jgi:hypothetical protein
MALARVLALRLALQANVGLLPQRLPEPIHHTWKKPPANVRHSAKSVRPVVRGDWAMVVQLTNADQCPDSYDIDIVRCRLTDTANTNSQFLENAGSATVYGGTNTSVCELV